jgi:SAM-dependent methyltransferase
MSNDASTRVPGEWPADDLDDEAPPEIPDISSNPEASPTEPIPVSLTDAELESLSEVSSTAGLRRLSPPPKPRRRERSITAPQTPTSRSGPPFSEDPVSVALKPPALPSLGQSSPAARDPARPLSSRPPPAGSYPPPMASPVPQAAVDLTRTQPSFAPPEPRPSARPSASVEVTVAQTPANGASAPPLIPPGAEPIETDPRSTTPAVLAMRIIAVGDTGRVKAPEPAAAAQGSQPPPNTELSPRKALEARVDAYLMADVDASAEAEATPARPNLDAAEELADDDVAPDSEDKPPPSLGRPSSQHAARDGAAEVSIKAPPPPPRRPLSSSPGRDESGREPEDFLSALEEPSAAAQKPREEPAPKSGSLGRDDTTRNKLQRRPWWEEVFSEDFVRAGSRLSDEQVRSEVDFIEESLGVAAGGVVLDLGCGAGYHAVELASRGYGVVGYDLSLFQLALAADVAQERGQRINFLQGDMREMAFEEMFDGIFCWNTAFGYFDEEKNIAVAQRVFKALRPGGMFLLDVVNRDFVAAHQPSQVWYEGDSCVCMDDMSLDFITSRLRVKRSIILDDGRTRESTYSVRLYALHELGKILHDIGFRVTEASGHPSTPGVFFGQCSPRIVILAQRP